MYDCLFLRISRRKMFKLQFYILLVISVQNSSCVVNTLSRIGYSIQKLYAMVDDMKLGKEQNATEVYDIFSYNYFAMPSNVRLRMMKTHELLSEAEMYVNPKIISDVFGLLSSDLLLSAAIDMIERSVQSIDDKYEKFHQNMNHKDPHSAEILNQLARDIIVGTEGKIEVIRSIILHGHEFLLNNETLLSVIAREAKNRYEVICDNSRTISETLVRLFQMVVIAELKVNVMLLFVNTYRYYIYEGWEEINIRSEQQLEKEFAMYTLEFEKYIFATDTMYLRRCDAPGGWLDGVNFAQLEEAVQRTIFHYNRNTCNSYTCNYIRFSYPEYCEVGQYDTRTGCSGISAHCAWLDSIDACVVDSGNRRFEYMNSSIGFYGKRSECIGPQHNKITDWNSGRSYCSCDCYGSNKISVQLLESDWKNQKVITGLRFVRQRKILHIQVREGQLTAHGLINQQSSDEDGWKPLPGVPYYEMVDMDTRTFFLDDLRLPPDYALTAVNFIKIIRGSVSGFAIKIQGRPFKYETGRLDAAQPDNFMNMLNMRQTGKPLNFKRISSEQTKLPHKVNPRDIAYVMLDRSDLTNDFGQTTLPFFDTLPVITTPPAVLGGVGLFHKGVDGFAGLFSLRLYPIEYSKYFKNFNDHKIKNNIALFNYSTDDE